MPARRTRAAYQDASAIPRTPARPGIALGRPLEHALAQRGRHAGAGVADPELEARGFPSPA
jgi:hypothetical protein